jgi:hypothetical protein
MLLAGALLVGLQLVGIDVAGWVTQAVGQQLVDGSTLTGWL